jgi:hypothetical protein
MDIHFKRAALVIALCTALFGLTTRARGADKPPKIPVAMGKWTGPHAGSFKSSVRGAIGKDCVVVKADKARVVIEGEVTEKENKHLTLRVILKSPKTSEVVESKEYEFSKPSPSHGQAQRMGKDVFEMARRAPE